VAKGARFQSTPPRGRRPAAGELTLDLGYRFQSTPPRGRRRGPPTAATHPAAFQSTPPRGRRPSQSSRSPDAMAFQSTPPRGRRLRRRAKAFRCTRVSIHASAREATKRGGRGHGFFSSFNPRLRAGGDWRATDRSFASTPTFQSTPPRGRRPTSSASVTRPSAVSIHASAREATRVMGCRRRRRRRVSIHASAREATRRLRRAYS